MDSFRFEMEEDKAEEMQREDQLGDLAKLVRSVELLAAIFFLGWILIHLPFAVNVLVMFVHRVLAVIVSPLFIFVLCNVLVVTLFKTCRPSAEILAKDNAGTELYEEVVQPIEYFGQPVLEEVEVVDEEMQLRALWREEVEYEDKVTIFEECSCSPTWETDDDEEMEMEEPEMVNEKEAELQPSEPEMPTSLDSSVDIEENRYAYSCPTSRYAVTNEEFNRIIDAFIEKQLNFFRHQEFIARAIETYIYVRG